MKRSIIYSIILVITLLCSSCSNENSNATAPDNSSINITLPDIKNEPVKYIEKTVTSGEKLDIEDAVILSFDDEQVLYEKTLSIEDPNADRDTESSGYLFNEYYQYNRKTGENSRISTDIPFHMGYGSMVDNEFLYRVYDDSKIHHIDLENATIKELLIKQPGHTSFKSFDNEKLLMLNYDQDQENNVYSQEVRYFDRQTGEISKLITNISNGKIGDSEIYDVAAFENIIYALCNRYVGDGRLQPFIRIYTPSGDIIKEFEIPELDVFVNTSQELKPTYQKNPDTINITGKWFIFSQKGYNRSIILEFDGNKFIDTLNFGEEETLGSVIPNGLQENGSYIYFCDGNSNTFKVVDVLKREIYNITFDIDGFTDITSTIFGQKGEIIVKLSKNKLLDNTEDAYFIL